MLALMDFAPPGLPAWTIVLAGVALVIFGDRLPALGRRLGRGIVKFRRALYELEERL